MFVRAVTQGQRLWGWGRQRWERFWFAEGGTHSLGAMRIALGLFVLQMLVCSIPNWQQFYGPNGYFPLTAYIQSMNGFADAAIASVLAWSPTPLWSWAVFGVGVVSAIAFTLGLQTRIATVVLFAVWASLLHRSLMLVNGQDQIVKLLLFFGCFAPLGRSYSWDRWWAHKHKQPWSEVAPVWPMRLMQVSIAFVYLFSAPAKWNDDIMWRNGLAIYYVTLSDRWFRFPDVALFQNIPFSVFSTYSALATEMGFPLLVWFKTFRPWVLMAIATMHFGICILLSESVWHFNMAMLISFLAFVDPPVMRRWGRRWTVKGRRRLRWVLRRYRQQPSRLQGWAYLRALQAHALSWGQYLCQPRTMTRLDLYRFAHAALRYRLCELAMAVGKQPHTSPRHLDRLIRRFWGRWTDFQRTLVVPLYGETEAADRAQELALVGRELGDRFARIENWAKEYPAWMVAALAHLQDLEALQREHLWPHSSDGALAAIRATAYLSRDRETLVEDLTFVLPGLPPSEAIAYWQEITLGVEPGTLRAAYRALKECLPKGEWEAIAGPLTQTVGG
ncbi:MAG: HTTM domain-containing protein [Oscillatoriales cyanobacterium SM2_1_8]|nr:HTTM domain-containing protein [Oscillatoriales cyanobacterium SM2_1_8]